MNIPDNVFVSGKLLNSWEELISYSLNFKALGELGNKLSTKSTRVPRPRIKLRKISPQGKSASFNLRTVRAMKDNKLPKKYRLNINWKNEAKVCHKVVSW